MRFGVVPARLQRAGVQRDGLGFLAELLAEGLLHQREIDAEQLCQHAVVNHVADEAAEFGVRTDRTNQLVERHRIEDQIVPQRVELQRLVVDHGCARLEREHILFGRFGIHRHEKVDLFFPGDVVLLAGADGVPRRQSGNVRREHVLA